MKKSHIIPLFTALALALVAPAQITMAATYRNQNQNNNNNNRNQPKKHVPTTIQAITATSITVKDDKKTTTYAITNLTEVDYKGQRVNPTDLKPGMLVVVTVGMNPADADRISADGPPKKQQKPTPTPKPKQ